MAKRIYFDMDGVLVDFEPSYLKATGGLTHNDNSEMYKAVTKLLSQTDFFLDLPPSAHFYDLANYMRLLTQAGIEVHILTSLGENWNVDRGVKTYANKVAWLKKYLSPLFDGYTFHAVPSAGDKARYGDLYSFLIDDRADTCENFKRNFGRSYVFDIETLKDPEMWYEFCTKVNEWAFN
jgi:hypothetical protein